MRGVVWVWCVVVVVSDGTAYSENTALGDQLIQAVMTKDIRLAETLLNLAAPVDFQDDQNGRNNPPLVHAVMRDDVPMASLLIRFNATIDTEFYHYTGEDPIVRTPLMIAAENNYLEMTQVLLAAGADPNFAVGKWTVACNERQLFPFSAICWNLYSYNCAKQLHLFTPTGCSTRGYTALDMAKRNGHRALSQLLLDAGADKDAKGQELMSAILEGNEAFVETLFNDWNNSDYIRSRDLDGRTPLMYAAALGNTPILAALLNVSDRIARVLCVNMKDKDGRTAVMHAAANNHTEAVEALLHSVRLSDGGYVPLLLAVLNNNTHMARAVLEHSTFRGYMEYVASNVYTAAARRNNADIIEMLLNSHWRQGEFGDEYGETALGIAEKRRLTKIINLLIDTRSEVPETPWPLIHATIWMVVVAALPTAWVALKKVAAKVKHCR